MRMGSIKVALLLVAFLAPSLAAAQAPEVPTAPPLVGAEEPAPAPPALVGAEEPAPAPFALVGAEEPAPAETPPVADPHSVARVHAGENRTQRLLFASLGAVLGTALAATPTVALFVSGSCRTSGESCALLSIATFFPGVALLPPLGIYLFGRAFGGAGGYWWTVLGGAAGWLVSGVLYSALGSSTRGSDTLLVLGGGCAVAAATGVLAFEWSSSRNLAPPVAGLTIVPWTAPGGGGLGVAGGF
ncbi:MAG: hypothetical protein ACYC8T_27560 [Myxococcaceae bacterium]